jgi:hypothetical protein
LIFCVYAMKVICILFLVVFSKAEAWVSTSPLLVQTRHRQTALGATEETAMRRTFLWSAAAALVAVVPQLSMAAAVEDPLEAFGKTLSATPPPQLGWPHSPSPLPTSVKSAAELTAPSTQTKDPVPASDLMKALEESSKKKKVDPRTHG